MKKKLLSVILAGMLLSSVAACGGNSGGDSNGDSGSNSGSGGEAEEVTIQFLSWQGDETKRLEEEAIDAYMEENPNITVEPQFVTYSDYTSKLNTLLAGESEPDVYLLQEYYTLQYGEEGLTEDLSPYFEAIGVDPAEKYVPGTAAMSGSQCFGVGKDSGVIMLYYNKPLFEQYGVETPPTEASEVWSWDEYVDIAKQLTIDANGNNAASSNFDPENITTYGTYVSAPWLTWLPFIYSAGGSFASEDGMSSNLASPETIDAVTKLNELINVHHVAPTPAVMGSMPTGAAMMLANQLAMVVSGISDRPAYEEAGVDYGIAPLPKIQDAKTISWTAHYVCSARTDHQQEAFDFLYWFIDPETNPLVLQHGLPSNKEFLTNNRDQIDEIYGVETVDAILNAINDTAVVPENLVLKNFGEIADQYFTPAMDRVMYGEATAEEVLTELDSTCASFFEGRWDQ